MITVMELLTVILLLGIPATIVMVLILHKDQATAFIQMEYPAESYAYPTQTQMNCNNPKWWIEFRDMENGRCISKVFYGSLIIGRYLPITEGTGRLFIRDLQTISRNQCLVTAYNGFLWVENLSKVNITKQNGIPVEEPQLLRVGDLLSFGGHDFLVVQLGYCA